MIKPIEREIIKRLSKSDKEIAEELGFTVSSIKGRVHRIINKLEVYTRTQALIVALIDDIIKIEEVQF